MVSHTTRESPPDMYSPDIPTWLNPSIQYLFGREIIEYDIKSAGLSITKAYHLLPDEIIQRWETMEKKQRNIHLGLERRDNKTFSKQLSEKFAEVRKFFLMFNQLKESDIISVKNDAIFTVGEQSVLTFGEIEFRPKNRYHSYVRFMDKIEVLIGDQVDVKGMGVNATNSHRLYLLTFIQEIASKIEQRSPGAIRSCIRFIDEFKTGKLEDPYYLEFTPQCRKQDPMQVYMNVLIPLLEISMRECQ